VNTIEEFKAFDIDNALKFESSVVREDSKKQFFWFI
jgi:hypothetical protein